ncbi:MAG: RluA family pseudouridine synthase [Eubacteriaceae bacterium]
MKEICIGINEANQRLDRFLLKYMSLASKGFVEKMIRKKRIKVNDKKVQANYNLKKNDKIQLYLAIETIEKFRKEKKIIKTKGKLDILFEDCNILVINKEKNMLTHGGNNSLVDKAIEYLIDKGCYKPEKEITFTPACCNRLDRNTTGIVIVAKTYRGLQEINNKIKDNDIKKQYISLVKGSINEDKKLIDYLKKDNRNNKVVIEKEYSKNSKRVETHIFPINNFKDYTMLEIHLITGRSHQIRAHLDYIGHPIVGDLKYGDRYINEVFNKKYNLDSQFLHAHKIIIEEYNGAELSIIAPLPKKLKEIINNIN